MTGEIKDSEMEQVSNAIKGIIGDNGFMLTVYRREADGVNIRTVIDGVSPVELADAIEGIINHHPDTLKALAMNAAKAAIEAKDFDGLKMLLDTFKGGK